MRWRFRFARISTCAWRRSPRASRCSSSRARSGRAGRPACRPRWRAARYAPACCHRGLPARGCAAGRVARGAAAPARSRRRGNSVCQPAINLFVSEEIAADRQGLGFGIKQSGIPAAILVSGLALPVLAMPLGWRVTFALCALGPLAVWVALRGRPASVRRPGVAATVTRAGPHRRRSGARHGRAERARRVSRSLGSGCRHRRGHRRPARRGQQRAEPRGARVARRARGPAARLRTERRWSCCCWRVGWLRTDGADAIPPFVAGTLLAFTLGWGWPGLFNLAWWTATARRRARHRRQPDGHLRWRGGGPAGVRRALRPGYDAAWLVVAAMTLLAAGVMWLAARADARIRASANWGV